MTVRGMTEGGTAPEAPALVRRHRPSAAPVALLHGDGRRRDGPEDGHRQRRKNPADRATTASPQTTRKDPAGSRTVRRPASASSARQTAPGVQTAVARSRATASADQREDADGPDERPAGNPGPRGQDVHPDRADHRPAGEPDEPPAAHGRPEVRDELPPAAALMGRTPPQMPCAGGEGRGVGDDPEAGHGDPHPGEQTLGEDREALAEHGLLAR